MKRIDLPAETFPAQWQDEREQDEAEQVRRWRIQAAKHAGLSLDEATRFADGDGDIQLLRDLADHGCAPRYIARIVT